MVLVCAVNNKLARTGTLQLMNARSLSVDGIIASPEDSSCFCCLSFNRDGSVLAAGSEAGFVHVISKSDVFLSFMCFLLLCLLFLLTGLLTFWVRYCISASCDELAGV